SSGCPGYLIWPFSPSSLNQASHFCMDFCISSGDCAVGSLPRKRNVNSLIVCPLGSYASHLRRSSEAAPDIFFIGQDRKEVRLSLCRGGSRQGALRERLLPGW